ncbi:PREDICTED: zinc finger protein 345-like [Priapulus caudatus]|uniref:Zinc finger protein 345-like n=1 Tax=Priapulus caudatus TaxID=37621 RepID=A0ABM1E216_PRICU|nr:PREDICTED: zinc finger protein 345-like [Priapulus caudatus]
MDAVDPASGTDKDEDSSSSSQASSAEQDDERESDAKVNGEEEEEEEEEDDDSEADVKSGLSDADEESNADIEEEEDEKSDEEEEEEEEDGSCETDASSGRAAAAAVVYAHRVGGTDHCNLADTDRSDIAPAKGLFSIFGKQKHQSKRKKRNIERNIQKIMKMKELADQDESMEDGDPHSQGESGEASTSKGTVKEEMESESSSGVESEDASDESPGMMQLPQELLNFPDVAAAAALLMKHEDEAESAGNIPSLPPHGAPTLLKAATLGDLGRAAAGPAAGPAKYSCHICGHEQSTRKDYLLHQRAHRQEYTYHCRLCGAACFTARRLEEHMAAEHVDAAAIPCRLCGAEFRSYAGLKHHEMLLHRPAGAHTCDACLKSFRTRADLRRHERAHDRQFVCATCGKQFGLLHHLQVHEAMHRDAYEFACSHCDYASKYKSSLRRHEEKQHGAWRTAEKPCVCIFCGKEYSLVTALNRHQETCTGPSMPKKSAGGGGTAGGAGGGGAGAGGGGGGGEEPGAVVAADGTPLKTYACYVCNKLFKSKSDCNRHERAHLRQFTCAVCGREFGFKHHLQNHMAIHSDEIRFPCPHCEFASNFKSALRRHVEVMHNKAERAEKSRICMFCGKAFYLESTLKRHQKNCRGPKEEPRPEPVREHGEMDFASFLDNNGKS